MTEEKDSDSSSIRLGYYDISYDIFYDIFYNYINYDIFYDINSTNARPLPTHLSPSL